jgi:acetyl-CoA acetyltransferase
LLVIVASLTEEEIMPEAVLVSAVRTPVGRAPKGALSTTRPDDLAALAITSALDRAKGLDRAEVEDVILGCAQQEGESGWNMARMSALRAQLPIDVPGMTVNRLCASGLEAIAQADMRIRSGTQKVVIAGGAESMSILPMGGLKPRPNPWLAENYPAALLTMGLTAERVAKHYRISREDADALSLASHRKALAAQSAGKFSDEFVPVAGCLPEEMGMGPVYAVPKALKKAGLTLNDVGLIELNEAFAAQALAVIRELGLDPEKVNVNGGAVALGHPLGCTGAKLTATVLNEMRRRKVRYGMVTMCVGGGQGAAGIFELLSTN